MKPKAIYYSILKYQPSNLNLIHSAFDVIELPDPSQDSDAVLEKVHVVFAPLGFQVDAKKMSCSPRLAAIISNTTGVPHIDMEEARKRGIEVCALHNEKEFLDTITPTAEHTIGLMMAVWRKIPAAHQAACAGSWDRSHWGAPRMLSRMQLGIVGNGRLGRKVACVAAALGMKTAYYDPFQTGSSPSLMDLAQVSDVLSIHVPANTQTKNLVSRDVLKALPSGALVINTARGEILDLDALLDFLEDGHLAGAALDTLDGEYELGFEENLKSSRVLQYARKHSNLILTPHIGGSTVDAWTETQRFVILKACRVFQIHVGQEVEANQ